ncbi:putative cytochrome p450 [Diplodia seriata]|uniref:Putative cytochrome p450 n=1 Tax=Diplodia seriata TaxID=420778 RepID=A0A0G2G029_9PEZI|nr:putative cytochrome p450 [Diplodia seriata]
MVSNIYSNSTLLSSPALENITQTILNERFIPALRSAIAGSKDVDVYSLFGGTSMDIVTGYIFGLPSSTDFTTDETERRRFHDLYFSRRGPDFWLQFPGLVRLLRQIGIKLIPDRFVAATLEIEAFVMAMCDKAAARIPATSTTEPLEGAPPPPPSHHPTVYAHLSTALTAQAALTDTPTAAEATRLALASECMDHVVAGYETSTVTLTYLCWHLSRQPSIQHALRREIQGIIATNSASAAFTVPSPSPHALTSLPLLHACVTETLRLHAGAPEIKHVIAALYANFETEIVDDGGIEQEDHFLAHPKGHRLILRLKEMDARE